MSQDEKRTADYTARTQDRVAILKGLRVTGPRVVGWGETDVSPPTANTLVATGLAEWVEADGTGVRKIRAK